MVYDFVVVNDLIGSVKIHTQNLPNFVVLLLVLYAVDPV